MPPPARPWTPRAVASFPQRTTEDCYRDFPLEVHASCPLDPSFSLDVQGTSARLAAGPIGGTRHRPEPEEERTPEYAQQREELERNRRWLSARRGPHGLGE